MIISILVKLPAAELMFVFQILVSCELSDETVFIEKRSEAFEGRSLELDGFLLARKPFIEFCEGKRQLV